MARRGRLPFAENLLANGRFRSRMSEAEEAAPGSAEESNPSRNTLPEIHPDESREDGSVGSPASV